MVVNHSPKVADKDLRNFSPDDELFHPVKEKLSMMKKGNKTADDDHFYVPETQQTHTHIDTVTQITER